MCLAKEVGQGGANTCIDFTWIMVGYRYSVRLTYHGRCCKAKSERELNKINVAAKLNEIAAWGVGGYGYGCGCGVSMNPMTTVRDNDRAVITYRLTEIPTAIFR